MSSDTETKKQPALLLAEFDKPDAVLHAAEKVRDAGFSKWDVHTPYPIHGMDAAMGMGDSVLGWIVFIMACTGISAAFSLMYWANGIEYPIIIGGKPPDAFPSMVPIMFELTILFSALGSFFGMLGLNQLPRHNHPVFNSERFDGCSNDKFFISVEAGDPRFDATDTRQFLETLSPTHLELVEEDV